MAVTKIPREEVLDNLNFIFQRSFEEILSDVTKLCGIALEKDPLAAAHCIMRANKRGFTSLGVLLNWFAQLDGHPETHAAIDKAQRVNLGTDGADCPPAPITVLDVRDPEHIRIARGTLKRETENKPRTSPKPNPRTSREVGESIMRKPPALEDVRRMAANLTDEEITRRYEARLSVQRDEQFEQMLASPWYWARHLTQTYDTHWREKGLASPYQSFPDKEYLAAIFSIFQNSTKLFVPKSREMLLSWLMVAYAVWNCEVFPRTFVLIQSQKDEKSQDLVGSDPGGYARTLYEQQPSWLRAKFPLKGEIKMNRMSWANGSILHGAAAGPDQVRMYHPSLYLVDEAAFLDDFKASYEAAIPVSTQIIAVSSAAPGWFYDQCATVLTETPG